MTYYLYSQYDKKASYYREVTCQKEDPTIVVEDFKHFVPYIKEENAVNLTDVDLYLVGTMDSETGEIIKTLEFILPLGDLIKKELEGRKNGKDN